MTVSIVIVGDKHSPITKSCVRTLSKDFEIIIEPFTGNYNQSLNNGAIKSSGDYIAFCNNDLIFSYNWFDMLLPHFEKYDSLSPYCPLTHHKWWKQSEPTGIVEGYEIGKILPGWCFVMTRKAYDEIIQFDESVSFWYSDNIYADQLQYHGLKHALVTNSFVTHLGSATLSFLGEEDFKELTTGQREIYNQVKLKYAPRGN